MPASRQSSVTTTATLTLGNGPSSWWLKETSPNTGTCTAKTTTTEDLSSLTAGTSYTYKAYSATGRNSANEIASETFSTLSATVTVSNLSETQATNASGNVGQIFTDNIKYAAGFTTGSNTGGYTLQSVTGQVRRQSGFALRVHRRHPRGIERQPGVERDLHSERLRARHGRRACVHRLRLRPVRQHDLLPGAVRNRHFGRTTLLQVGLDGFRRPDQHAVQRGLDLRGQREVGFRYWVG